MFPLAEGKEYTLYDVNELIKAAAQNKSAPNIVPLGLTPSHKALIIACCGGK